MFWTHPMELLDDVGHAESGIGPFGDSVSIGARKVHGLRQTYHRLRNRLDAADGTTSNEAQVEARFGPFGDSANLDAR